MPDLDDVQFQRTPEGRPPERPASQGWVPVVLLACALLGAVVAGYIFLRRSPARDAARAETEQAVGPRAAAGRLPAEPGEDIPLPPLDETDALVRALVARLSSHPRVAAWLTTDRLIRSFTVAVVNLADGHTPAPRVPTLAPDGPFQVVQQDGHLYIDSRAFQRYDGHAAAVSGIDARGAARLYATLKPRIDEAYNELGAPHGDFDTTLERAIARLLQTPGLTSPVAVVPAGAGYRFADPALESLSPAQKQLLRMGPENARIVQAKLREVARYLGIPSP
jgi:Protein of unknown function (DUF3014)